MFYKIPDRLFSRKLFFSGSSNTSSFQAGEHSYLVEQQTLKVWVSMNNKAIPSKAEDRRKHVKWN